MNIHKYSKHIDLPEPEVVTLSFTGERPDHQMANVALGGGSSTLYIAPHK